jgi:YggT family protein
VVPDLGGIDLSPLVALVLLQLAKMMILPPLHELATLLS